jgi:hypothetical protein
MVTFLPGETAHNRLVDDVNVEILPDSFVSRLEIRIVRSRQGRLPGQFMRIFGADSFRPFARRRCTQIDDGRRPWRREGASILDRELELQVLALEFRSAITPESFRTKLAFSFAPRSNAATMRISSRKSALGIMRAAAGAVSTITAHSQSPPTVS